MVAQLHPALKLSMGTWEYYSVKMSMKDLVANVTFAHEIYPSKTLSTAMQRVLDGARAKKEIARYLVANDDRFFNSIVIAVVGGKPTWFPVTLDDDPRFAMITEDDGGTGEIFGVLRFDGNQKYYALDGQHRLKAIREVLDPTSDLHPEKPKDFENENINVVLVVNKDAEGDEEFMVKYRRLFGHLNRYAKAPGKFNNIIMDEDDAFAIITRRLVAEHNLFFWDGSHKESMRVKVESGQGLNQGHVHLIAIETLYDFVEDILKSPDNIADFNWSSATNLRNWKQSRPDDELLEEWYLFVSNVWDVVLKLFPEISEPNSANFRNNAADIAGDETRNTAYFRPVVQQRLAKLIRRLLNVASSPTSATKIQSSLSALRKLNWDLYAAPWRNLVLVSDTGNPGDWKMNDQGLRPATNLAFEILEWQLGLESWTTEELEEEEDVNGGVRDGLKTRWRKKLVGIHLTENDIENQWAEILDGVL